MSDLVEFLRTHEEAFRSRSRLASLYSDFRHQRQTNPDGYQANVSAWVHALDAAAKAGLVPAPASSQHDRFSLHTGEELLRALQTQEYGRPLALGSVVEDAVRREELIPLPAFLEAKQSLYNKDWIPTPWEVLTWALRKVGVIGREGAEDKLVTGNFVIKANLEEAAKTIMDHVSRTATSKTARVFSSELFLSEMSSILGVEALSRSDLSVLLTHLARDHGAVGFHLETGIIKFKAPSEKAPPTIEQEDITIASLRTLIASLEPQVQALMTRVSDLDAKARAAVTSKQLIAAKTALRQKKLAETQLQQRTATLTQLEEVHAKIEQATDQLEMVLVMEASSQTLRDLNQKTGGVEKVQDVMEGLRDEMMTADEIQQAINDASAGTVDEGEVDDELEALEKAEKQKVEEAESKEREAREETERKEREKRETEESEMTRRRLAELDQVGQKKEEEQMAPSETQEPSKAT